MLVARGLDKSYGERRVLDGFSLRVEEGEVYGLIGRNGAGKSTAMAVLSGLFGADAGEVLVADQPLAACRQRLGVVAQEIALYDTLSCAQNLRFFGAIYGLRGEVLAGRVRRCLEAVDLLDRAKSAARTLSGGMRRRLHIAVGLVHGPRVLLLDEPTAGLDVASRRAVWDLVQRLAADGVAVLLTTHQGEEAERLCSQIGILRGGRLVAEGTMEALRGLIPAREIALVQAADEGAVLARAQERGLTCRRSESGVNVWLPEPLELGQILALFDGVALSAVSRRPVSLEDVYLEIG